MQNGAYGTGATWFGLVNDLIGCRLLWTLRAAAPWLVAWNVAELPFASSAWRIVEQMLTVTWSGVRRIWILENCILRRNCTMWCIVNRARSRSSVTCKQSAGTLCCVPKFWNPSPRTWPSCRLKLLRWRSVWTPTLCKLPQETTIKQFQ